MYSTEQICRGIQNPLLIGRQLNKLYYSYVGLESHPEAINFLDEDWDNLIILDACRYDSFVEYADIPGKTEYRYSLGSSTSEFTEKNFADRDLGGTVYVGANTWFLKLQDEINASIFEFVDVKNGEYEVTWVNEDLKVVTPETVNHHAKQIQNEFPNKRLIIHYLQPHHPFIGQTGRRYLSHQSKSLMEVFREAGPKVDKQQLQAAYDENLKRVLSAVEDLLPELPGKTVITADHGEMLGERHDIVPTKDYGHPRGIYNETLVKVPWHIIDTEERKHIIEEDSIKQHVNDERINDQLRDLGYVI